MSYKKQSINRILNRIYKQFPEYKSNLEILDSASMLTFKEYLNSEYGCAYGIAQKIGQFNLLGRLPLKNLYATGQSALFPGVLSCIIASFITGKMLIDNDNYKEFINSYLGKKDI